MQDAKQASGLEKDAFLGAIAKGVKWQLPDLDNSALAYRLARTAFEADGRRIVDATVGGALSVFPKLLLAEALQR